MPRWHNHWGPPTLVGYGSNLSSRSRRRLAAGSKRPHIVSAEPNTLYFEKSEMSDKPLILIVEDREDDIFIIRKTFQRACVTNPIQIVRDGEEAIAYLSGEGKYI